MRNMVGTCPIHEPVFVNGVCVGCTAGSFIATVTSVSGIIHECIWQKAKNATILESVHGCAGARNRQPTSHRLRSGGASGRPQMSGIDCGKSGLLVFDADTYKDTYGDLSEILSSEDRETVTVITGGGGEHFIYDRQDKPYGNSTRNLPAGIDIRGVGGYIVAAPSLHKSGNRYQYEEGYKPHQIKPLPIPSKLNAILATHTIAHTTPTNTASAKQRNSVLD